jgi:hypothetical protein
MVSRSCEPSFFNELTGDPAYDQLLRFVEDYFAAGPYRNQSKVQETMFAPLYLQHQGKALQPRD